MMILEKLPGDYEVQFNDQHIRETIEVDVINKILVLKQFVYILSNNQIYMWQTIKLNTVKINTREYQKQEDITSCINNLFL